MKSLIIDNTENSPKICFDIDKHNFLIEGNSKPENVIEFFKPVLDWLDNFYQHEIQENHVQNLTVEVKLDYYNTASSKYLAEIFGGFKKWQKHIDNIVIKWYYNEFDDMMLEDGKDLSFATDLPMEYIELPYEQD